MPRFRVPVVLTITAHDATQAYTKVAHSTVNTRKALKRTRSTNAPVIRAGVMMANIIW